MRGSHYALELPARNSRDSRVSYQTPLGVSIGVKAAYSFADDEAQLPTHSGTIAEAYLAVWNRNLQPAPASAIVQASAPPVEASASSTKTAGGQQATYDQMVNSQQTRQDGFAG